MALGKRPVRGQVIPCRPLLAISRTTTATFVNLNFARGFDIDYRARVVTGVVVLVTLIFVFVPFVLIGFRFLVVVFTFILVVVLVFVLVGVVVVFIV
jgi:hypothetical protein